MLNHEAEIMTITNRFTETNLKAKLAYDALNQILLSNYGLIDEPVLKDIVQAQRAISKLVDNTNWYKMNEYIESHLKTVA